MMNYFNEYDEPFNDGMAFGSSQMAHWDDMLNLLDNADGLQAFDVGHAVPASYAVIRLLFRPGLSHSAWGNWVEERRVVCRQNKANQNARPYSYTRPDRQSVLLWPQENGNSLDLVTWQPQQDNGHGSNHPETKAVEWLQRQQQINPDFNQHIERVNMMIQDEPCHTCLNGLKSSLQQVLPVQSKVQIKWVKPRYKIQSFRERRYQPKVSRWNRR